MEAPGVDAILRASRNNFAIVSLQELDVVHRVDMPNESLEELSVGLRGFIVPDLYHIILASS